MVSLNYGGKRDTNVLNKIKETGMNLLGTAENFLLRRNKKGPDVPSILAKRFENLDVLQ